MMAIAAVLSVVISIGRHRPEDFIFAFGTSCCLGGVISLLLAAVYNVAGKKEWAKGFLMSAGITFLVGTGVCSTILLTM